MDLEQLTAFRKQCGKNQEDFWKPLGITQSTASRYESGVNPLPDSVKKLLELVCCDDEKVAVSMLKEMRATVRE